MNAYMRLTQEIVSAFLLSLVGCSAVAGPSKFKTGKMNPILDNIKLTTVTRITVFSLPYRMTTFVAVTPESLVQLCKQPVSSNLAGLIRSDLIEALEKTNGRERTRQPDLRWGAHFFGPTGRCLHQIYLDASGTGAIIDGTSTRVNRRLIRWFERHFSNSNR